MVIDRLYCVLHPLVHSRLFVPPFPPRHFPPAELAWNWVCQSVRPSVCLSSFNSPTADMIYMKYYIGTFHEKLWAYFSFYVALTILTAALSCVFGYKRF